MADRVETIETIVTSSEVEALHLEQNLVKRHRPPFNVRLRDDKSFPYIAVTVEDDYPRVMFTRERHRRGVVLLRPVREREEGARDARRAEPRLPLPAVRRAAARAAQRHPVPRLPHRALPRALRRLHLEGGLPRGDRPGDRVPLGRRPADPRELERQMQEAAAEERFEDAARYRNRLHAIERLAERQAVERRVDRDDRRDRHRRRAGARRRAGVPAARRPDGRPLLVPSRERGGRGARRGARAVLPRVLRRRRRRSRRSSSSRAARATRRALEAFLSELRGSRVEVRAPERGEKRRLQELAQQNAQLALDSGDVRRRDEARAAASSRSRSCARR